METDPSSPDLRVVEGPVDSQPPPEAEPKPAVVEAKPAVRRPTKPLPTTRIAFVKQLDVLRGWAIASGPEAKSVTNKAVADIVKLNADTLTLANAFFAEAKLLQKGEGGYTPTAATFAFNEAYAWNPENAAHKLGPALADTWFGQALLPRLSFSAIPEDEAIQVLAEAATAAPPYRPQLVLILDYLQAAGVIVRDGGQVRLGSVRNDDPPTSAAPSEPSPTSAPAPPPKAGLATTFTQTAEGQIQFNVSFRVSMAEFADWRADRIAAFFNGIAQVLAAKADVEKGAAE